MVSPVITESIIKLGTYLEKDVPMFCSVSGGSDSDIVVDLICKYGFGKDVDFVFFDTGLEYKATKEHLDDLEEKYGISIRRLKAIKSIPHCCKEYGVPFISKHASNMLSRLQKHNFQFEDEDFDTLYKNFDNKDSLGYKTFAIKTEHNLYCIKLSSLAHESLQKELFSQLGMDIDKIEIKNIIKLKLKLKI